MWVSRGGYGRVGVAWWVWVSCGSARWVLLLSCGSSVTAWVAARFQALTSHFGSFTHGVGSGKVSRLSLSFFFFEKPLSLSLSCLSLRFSIWKSHSIWGFFFSFRFSVWTSETGVFCQAAGVFFFFFGKLTYLDLFIYIFFTSGLAGWVTILEELKLFVRG